MSSRILVIDPSFRQVQRLVEDCLIPYGLQVVHVSSSSDGLQRSESWNPDLIIVDMEAARAIEPDFVTRLVNSGNHVPLIVTSDDESVSCKRWAFRLGAADFWPKPLDLDQTFRSVRRVLGGQIERRGSQNGRTQPAESYESLSQELASRAREISVLRGLGKTVSSVHDFDEMLKRVVEGAVYLTEAEEGFLLLLDKESGELYLRAGQGLANQLAEGFRVKAGDSAIWQVLRTGEPTVIESSTGRELKVKTGYLAQALLHVPLKLRGQVIGVLSVSNKARRERFTDSDVKLLVAMADFAALAIDSLQRYETSGQAVVPVVELPAGDRTEHGQLKKEPDVDELHNRAHELRVLQDLGRAVNSVRDLEELLTKVVEGAVYLTGAEEGFLLLLDEATGDLYLRAGQGLGKRFAEGFRVRSNNSAVWDVIRTGEPKLIASSSDDRLKIKTGYLVQALLHVPLSLRGQVIGVLSVNNKVNRRSFDERDVQLLSTLTDFAAIAIDNMQQRHSVGRESARTEIRPVSTDSAEAVENLPLADPLLSVGRLAELAQVLRDHQDGAQDALRKAEQILSELAGQVEVVEQLAGGLVAEANAQTAAMTVDAGRPEPVKTEGSHVPLMPPVDWEYTLTDLGVGLLFATPQCTITRSNPQANLLLGSDDLKGLHLRTVHGSSNWRGAVEAICDQSRGHSKRELTFWSLGRMLKASFVPTTGHGGYEWMVILKDLFRARGAQHVAEELTAPFVQRLRTPLTILSSYTELLLAETVGLLVPTQRRLLERMRTSLQQLNKQISTVSCPAPESDMVAPISVAADLRVAMQGAIRDATPWIQSKGQTLRMQVPDLLPKVAAQIDCVQQMIRYLLRNSVQATPLGGAVGIKVGVSHGRAAPHHVVVSFQDQGGGIAASDIGRLFDRLRADEQPPISGLGSSGTELASAKTLVEAFGGRIWVEATSGQGSTFSFILPAVTTN